MTPVLAAALFASCAESESSADPCADQACNGHGQCEEVAGAPRCSCNEGYRAEGLSCELEWTIPPFFDRTIVPLGELAVVPVGGEPYGRKLLAASLQGVVNSTEVRLYLVDGDQDTWRYWELDQEEATQRHWLDVYAARHGVVVGGELALDDALAQLSGEATGYVMASEEEPWTINAATIIAGQQNALVVTTAEEATLLESLGLTMIENLGGRWSAADDCIHGTFQELYPEANPAALAIVWPFEYRIRDFLLRNRIFVIFGHPNGDADAWSAVQWVLEQTPPNLPIFGYLSLDGIEEYAALLAISSSGKYLIPTDSAANLTVHSAIPAQIARPELPATDCAPGTLRVTIAVSDGDNLAVPLNRYVTDGYWLSAARGSFPVGWSMAPALIDLAPGIAAYYATELGANEELVAELGIGYTHPTELAQPGHFFRASFTALERQGMTSLWLIDPNLDAQDNDNPIWEEVSYGYTDRGLAGLLVGFMNLTGAALPEPFWTSAGAPVVFNANSYFDEPDDIEQRIRAALAAFRAGGPDVMFISAALWTNDLDGLAQAIESLASEEDLTFLTPSQLFACMQR